jgi:hypothetical protein
MRETETGLDEQLTRLVREVSIRRANFGKRSVQLPEELWGEIVAMARKVGVNRTSRALGLWYYAVKKRMGALEQTTGSSRVIRAVAVAGAPPVRFLELTTSQGLLAGQGCVIEMQRGDGARVTVRQAQAEHVAAVAQSFLGVRA